MECDVDLENVVVEIAVVVTQYVTCGADDNSDEDDGDVTINVLSENSEKRRQNVYNTLYTSDVDDGCDNQHWS